MSLQLYMFLVDDEQGNHPFDFPFRTPTALTMEVLTLETTEARLALLQKYIDTLTWEPELKALHMRRAKELMEDPKLELGFM